MNQEPVINRVKKLLVDKLHIDKEPGDISDDELLFAGGLGLDSIDSLEIIIAVEKDFGIRITDEEIKGNEDKIFKSVKSLADHIESRLNSKK